MCLHTLALVKFESLAEAKAQQDAEALRRHRYVTWRGGQHIKGLGSELDVQHVVVPTKARWTSEVVISSAIISTSCSSNRENACSTARRTSNGKTCKSQSAVSWFMLPLVATARQVRLRKHESAESRALFTCVSLVSNLVRREGWHYPKLCEQI